MIRGEIWWVQLHRPRGSEPGFTRPALVIQNNRFSRSAINTVVVATITSNQRLANAPGNVLLAKGTAGLDRPSVVNVSQIVTLDKSDFVFRSGQLDNSSMKKVVGGLRSILDL